MDQPRQLVLASGSRYRKELLGRLGLAFEVAVPDVDESPRSGEAPADTALRLAVLKARALEKGHAGALIIGSDQVASCDGRRFEKPGNRENARRQLLELSGKTAQFDTAAALLDARNGSLQTRVVPCRVTFRKLGEDLIERYLEKEQPYDCAGAAKAEGLGIALIARIETEDPTSLIGLPLIALSEMLRKAGLSVP
jgi:7-methyl-GTP pyrophosphatase